MKFLKSTLFMSVGVVLVFCLSLGGYAKPARAEIHPNVTEIIVLEFTPPGGEPTGGSFAYLIRGKKTAIIDTGAEPVGTFIGPALEELGMTPEDVDYILDTSFHGDHTKANFELQELSGAKVCIHKSVADYLGDPELGYEETIAPAALAMLGPVGAQEHKYNHLNPPWDTPTVNRQLKEGDVIKLKQGMKLRVLHLPGHETGDIGYYLKNKRILFSGGSVRGVQGVRGALPVIYDMDAYEQTIERIKGMKLNQLLTYHPGRSITIDRTNRLVGDEIDLYLEEILESIEIMREAAEEIAEAGTFKTYPNFWASYNIFVGRLPPDWGLRQSTPRFKPFFGGVTFLNLMNKVLEK